VVLKDNVKVPNKKVAKYPESVFFSYSDLPVQNCMTLSQWFSLETADFYTEQCTIPSLFTASKSHKVHETIL